MSPSSLRVMSLVREPLDHCPRILRWKTSHSKGFHSEFPNGPDRNFAQFWTIVIRERRITRSDDGDIGRTTVNNRRLLSSLRLSLRSLRVDAFGKLNSQSLKSFARSARSGIVELCRFFSSVAFKTTNGIGPSSSNCSTVNLWAKCQFQRTKTGHHFRQPAFKKTR